MHQVTPGERCGEAGGVTPGCGEAQVGKALCAPQEAPSPHDTFGSKRVTGRPPSLFIYLTNLQNFLGCGEKARDGGRERFR